MIIPITDKTIPPTIAVLVDSIPLAISLVFQKEITGAKITPYSIKLEITVHSPNSSGVNVLVIITINAKPVNKVDMDVTNEINPEYITLMFDN